jgi:hypothetical protein
VLIGTHQDWHVTAVCSPGLAGGKGTLHGMSHDQIVTVTGASSFP